MHNMLKLICVRHGESVWNQSNRFTGWTDVDLSERGETEAREAGRIIQAAGLNFKVAFTSYLKRAARTLRIMLDAMGKTEEDIQIERAWQLNERHYGDLQGYNKAEKAAEVGEAQVKIWRRSYDVPPPPLSLDDKRHPRHDAQYQDVDATLLPATESLKDTVARVIPYWKEQIVPMLKKQSTIIVVAHGNSLRALVKYLDNISDEEIVELNIPTGIPFVYELSTDISVINRSYLGDAEAARHAAEKVAAQSSVKK